MHNFSFFMKAGVAGFLFSLLVSTSVFSQSCPAQETQIFPELSGQALIDALVSEYGTTDNIEYDAARDIMYGEIDNKNGQITGIYTSYTITLNPDADPSTDAFNKNINAEHAWPQNKGSMAEPARSDLHHLYPAYASANSARNRDPFIEIPDTETESWWRNDESTSSPDANFIDEYSERKDGHPSGLFHPGNPDNPQRYDSWEPREDAKGDIARSMFYFYTMYKSLADEADPNFFEVQKPYLREWNTSEAVSDKEYQRTCAIAEISGNKVNPFVIDPTLVERAYFEGQISQTNVGFSATVLNINEDQSELEIKVSISNPNPDTATTVDVVYAGGTATAGEDFQPFNTQTLTFAAGSFEQQSVTLSFTDDEVEEVDETILLALQNVTGPQKAGITEADTTTITIRDNDGVAPTIVWINEFHYDNNGGDTGEFVELGVNERLADLSEITLTLYNGKDGVGVTYASYSASDFEKGETVNGISFYYLELPSNGIQNGSPDGLSLDIGGDLVQFLSYEGVFTATEGPAQNVESTDIGVEQTGESPVGSSVSLAGTGRAYNDFEWEFTETNTMGEVNGNQTIEEGEDPIPIDPVVISFVESERTLFEGDGAVEIVLSISNPNPDTATTVQVSRVGGTASEDEDFEAFETQSLTFAPGSSENQSFEISILDDDFYEKNETILLAIQNIEGPADTQIGTPDTVSVTIVNDDANYHANYLWINEFHYQNAGADSNEFVEIAFVTAVPTKQNFEIEDEIAITLYNGNDGLAYATLTGEDLKQQEESINSGVHRIFYADISGIQNGDPDGIALSMGGEFNQFLSYGGSFAAKEGPAKDHQSEDIGIIQPEDAKAVSSLALTGSGENYGDFMWVRSDSATKGYLNPNQDLRLPSSTEDEETEIASEYKLSQNYPNPFNPSTVISYQLAENSTVRLQVFDMLGREVATLVNQERKSAGSHQLTFDAGNLSSGVYIYRLSTSSGVQLTKKMLLMK